MGRLAFRRRWYVLAAWLAVLGGVVVAGLTAAAAPPDNPNIPGTEFSAANTLIQQKFHANPNGASAQIVLVAPHGQKITAYEKVISEVVAQAARSPQVASWDTPAQTHQVSRDGSTAIADVNYNAANDSLTSSTTNALENATACRNPSSACSTPNSP